MMTYEDFLTLAGMVEGDAPTFPKPDWENGAPTQVFIDLVAEKSFPYLSESMMALMRERIADGTITEQDVDNYMRITFQSSDEETYDAVTDFLRDRMFVYDQEPSDATAD